MLLLKVGNILNVAMNDRPEPKFFDGSICPQISATLLAFFNVFSQFGEMGVNIWVHDIWHLN